MAVTPHAKDARPIETVREALLATLAAADSMAPHGLGNDVPNWRVTLNLAPRNALEVRRRWPMSLGHGPGP